MKIKKGFLVFCATLFAVLTLQAQDNTSMLLRKVYNKLQMAKDYSVVAKIKITPGGERKITATDGNAPEERPLQIPFRITWW